MAGEGKDPAEQGGTGKDTAVKGAGTSSAVPDVAELVKDQMASLENTLKSSLGGLIKKQVEGVLAGDTLKEMLGTTVAAQIQAANTPAPPEPTEIEGMKEKQTILETRLNESEKALEVAQSKAHQQSLKTGVRDILNVLNGNDNRPRVRDDAKNDLARIIELDHGNNLVLNEAGQIVIKTESGETLLIDKLSNGYFPKDHWALAKGGNTGSGAGRGTGTPSPASSDLTDISSREGRKKFGELADANPDEAIALAQQRQEETRNRMMAGRRR